MHPTGAAGADLRHSQVVEQLRVELGAEAPLAALIHPQAAVRRRRRGAKQDEAARHHREHGAVDGAAVDRRRLSVDWNGRAEELSFRSPCVMDIFFNENAARVVTAGIEYISKVDPAK